MKHSRLVIIGGGVTGLAAAWEAQTHIGDAYTLIESEPRLGGKVITARREAPGGQGTFVIDGGPESFVTRKPELTELAEEAGIAGDLIDPGAESAGVYVLTDGSPLPVPTSAGVFVRTPLLSLKAKARFLAEPFVKPRTDEADESLASFVTRRLGPEANERMMGPVLGGIYQADPERQSILVAAPVMRTMEKDHGSLFRAMLARGRARRRQPRRYPSFVSFEDGTQPLIDGIADRLTGKVMTGTEAVAVSASHGGGVEVTLSTGGRLTADAAVLACPAPAAASMLDHPAADLLREFRATDIGTATLVYPRGSLGRLAGIRGCMVPAREQRRIDAVMVTSQRMPRRGVAGYEMVRVVFGANDPALVGLPDDPLRAALHAELVDLFGVTADPLDIVSFRWPGGYPQADVGHLDRVDAVEASLPATVTVAGSAYRGVGVPDCIRQGRDAARRLLSKESR